MILPTLLLQDVMCSWRSSTVNERWGHIFQLILFYFSFRLKYWTKQQSHQWWQQFGVRFEQLSRQNQQQNERFEKLSETMDQRFTVMMEALKIWLKISVSIEKENMLLLKPVEKGPELRLSVNKEEPELRLRAQKSSRKQVTK